jgi:hypothetical protein
MLKTFYLNLAIFFGILLSAFFVGIFAMHELGPLTAIADEDDVLPPQIMNIRIKDISATSSVISWETDEEADSLVNFGLDKSYGMVRAPRFDKTEHEIVLENLLPGSTYFFRITSSDAKGNQGISSDHTFDTPKDKKVSIVGGEDRANVIKETLEEILDFINQVSSGEEMEIVDGKLDDKGAGDKRNMEGALGEILDMLKLIASEENIDFDEIRRGREIGRLEGGEGDANYVSLQEVLDFIQSVKEESVLEVIEGEVSEKAEEIVKPPTIILDYADVEVGTDYAIISWETDKEANSIVSLARESDYNPEAENPYTWKEGEPDDLVLQHSVYITGLAPATTYHFQVSSKSALDLTGRSSDKTFRTKSIAPEIYNIQIVKIEEEAATIRWTTNVPCSTIIEYTNLNNGETKLEGNSSFLTTHSIRLSNLVFDTYYSFVINVESEDGEKAESDPMTFITIRDRYPPVIEKVNTESTIYPGSDNKIQTIVSWRTDEEAVCQLFYHQGLVSVDEPLFLPKEEDYALRHVQVVTNFLPGSVYKFWIICEDEAGNKARSDDFSMLTPVQEESIIDIIIKNFESSFGWLKR